MNNEESYFLKLNAIASGWKNLLFKNENIEVLANERAKICAGCNNAIKGTYEQLIGDQIEDIEGMKCSLCDCPLSTLLRQKIKGCKGNKW